MKLQHCLIALGLLVGAPAQGADGKAKVTIKTDQNKNASKRFALINSTTRNDALSKETVLIADKGVAQLPIIVAPKSSPETRALADEVASTLKQITGATFAVKEGKIGPAICIGTIGEFPTASAKDGLKIFNAYDGREAFAIRVGNKSIKLLGATEKGTAFAVTRFLELLGCRWFFQHTAWNVVPKIEKLSFNRNQTDRPEMISRYMGFPLSYNAKEGDPDSGLALRTWWRHNYIGKSLQSQTGHSASEIHDHFRAEFDAHPEYSALVDGKRTPGQLCISNPKVQELAGRYACEYFDKHPDAHMVGVGPDDGGGWCQCEVCKAQFPNPGDGAFFLANAAGKAVQKKHPGKMVGIYAYNWHCDPPPFQLEPNVYVEVTSALLLNTKYSFEELLQLWPKKAKYVGVYDYWAVYDWTRDALPVGRTGNFKYVAEKLPEYINNGICGLTSESGNSWGGQGLGFYLASKILWNSKTDAEAVKQDFYDKAFGPAAEEMKNYYERVDLGNNPLVGPTFYRLALNDLERAEKAARGDKGVLARLHQLKQYHVYLYHTNRMAAQIRLGERADFDEKKKIAFDILKWNYRIRNVYMTFWGFFADQTTRRFADEYKEAKWNFPQLNHTGIDERSPYRDEFLEPTSEETNRILEEAKKFYGEPQNMDAQKWSEDYVAPVWPYGPIEVAPIYLQSAHTLVIEARQNLPLRFKIDQAVIYKNMPDGKYTIRDRKGVTIASGRVPKGNHTVEVPVPRDEFYYLDYEDYSAGWFFTPLVGVRSGFVLDPKKSINLNAHRGWFYIYVPKGLKEIRMYVNRTQPFTLRTPDRKPVSNIEGQESIASDGSSITIPVPEGMDGKLWFSDDMMQGSFYFLNIPNIILTRPDGPILPRELAQKDGLKF